MSLSLPPGTSRVTLRATDHEAPILRRAADALIFARHPGIADVVDLRMDALAVELDLAVPDGVPLRSLALALEEVAGVVATIGTTVADLHDIGVAIGGISVDGVVVTREGHAVLTDLGRTTRLTGARSHWPTHAVARRDDGDLGRLLTDLLDACAPLAVTDVLEAPRRGAWRRQSRPGAAVRRLAERASTGGISSRRLAEVLATEVPGACLPRRTRASGPACTAVAEQTSDDLLDQWFEAGCAASPHEPSRSHGARRSRWPQLVGLAAASVLVLMLTRPFAAGPSPRCTALRAGCVTFSNGVLLFNGARYAVGRDGDMTAVGRWLCGTPALALLRPSTGQVWLYRTWPAEGKPVIPVLGSVVPGGRRFAATAGTKCDALFVVDADGRRVRLSAGATA